MSRKEKTGVLIAMSLGVLAGATAAVKATTIPQVNRPDASKSKLAPSPYQSMQSLTPRQGASIPLLLWGTAEAAICIMAASIPILRALARGSFRQAVPGGYESGYPTTMVESSVAPSLSTQLPPPSQQAQGRSNSRGFLHWFGTSRSSETGAKRVVDDSSDEDSIEIAGYQTRAQTTVNLTRQNPN